jgi:hypothetical protein
MTRRGILLILLACCVERFQCPQQEPRGAMQDIFKLYAKYMQQICSEYAIICNKYATKLKKYA